MVKMWIMHFWERPHVEDMKISDDPIKLQIWVRRNRGDVYHYRTISDDAIRILRGKFEVGIIRVIEVVE